MVCCGARFGVAVSDAFILKCSSEFYHVMQMNKMRNNQTFLISME
jgi:hypothetical protein